MRTISTLLKSEIAAGRIARLLKITCKNGTIFAFTDTDMPITVDGQLYTPAPGLQSVTLNATSDSQVSNQTIGAAILQVPEADLIGGVFDTAVIEAAWASWKHPEAGQVKVFVGELGAVSWDEQGFVADAVSSQKKLDRTIGQPYTGPCRHNLFDADKVGRVGKCGLDPASYTFTGSITSVDTNKWKVTTTLSQPDVYFSGGVLTWTSGNNAGLSCTVKSQTGAQLQFLLATAFTTQVGDTFSVQAGCDKTLATCKAKFDNVVNFGGFPHISQDVTTS